MVAPAAPKPAAPIAVTPPADRPEIKLATPIRAVVPARPPLDPVPVIEVAPSAASIGDKPKA